MINVAQLKRTLLIVSLLLLTGCSLVATHVQGPMASALPTSHSYTQLDRLVQPLLDEQPAHASGVAFLGDAIPAFMARAYSARAAERSLDIQYYIWRHDNAGRILQHEIMKAAERGVRVRLLVDDVNVGGRDNELLAMAAHPNIQVRVFNPAYSRDSRIMRSLEVAVRFFSFNRRMHNKAWIADNRMAIVGGRNIGDQYFGAADSQYHDTDLLLIGEAVKETSSIFDSFWNAREVAPLTGLRKAGSFWSPKEFAKRMEKWRYAAADTAWGKAMASAAHSEKGVFGDALVFYWPDSVRVVSDPPEKAAPIAKRREEASWLMYDVLALLYSAEQDTWITSPYFVPGNNGVLQLAGQVKRGKRVRVLTNSLAANDVPLVHAGYKKYRRPLLEYGVELYEMKPENDETDREILGSSGASLHSKAFLVDQRRGFVGSFNLDPRSAQLNTEMGVFFDSPELAQELNAFFEKGISPVHAWQVGLNKNNGLIWQDASAKTWNKDPETSVGLRFLTWLFGLLPIESQL